MRAAANGSALVAMPHTQETAHNWSFHCHIKCVRLPAHSLSLSPLTALAISWATGKGHGLSVMCHGTQIHTDTRLTLLTFRVHAPR